MTHHVLLFRMVDPDYPRSKRVTEFLDTLPGVTTEVVPPATGSRLRRHLGDAWALLRSARRGDVIHLAEMQLQSIVTAAAVARIRGCSLVVDGFIGLHETYVDDWAVSAPGSLRARCYRALDVLARRAADCYLVDTEPRADDVRRDTTSPVLALAVGAPAWARPTLPTDDARDGVLRVLYYGNYIPLHGLDTVIDALAIVRRRRPIAVTFLGDGAARAAAEHRVRELALDDVVTFAEPVDEPGLAEVIARHDIVLGVFGTSSKAAGVIANKVWQGLACGRTVITRQAAALDCIAPTAGGALVQVPAGDAESLADALVASRASSPTASPSDVDRRLEALVQRSYAPFGAWLLSPDRPRTGATR